MLPCGKHVHMLPLVHQMYSGHISQFKMEIYSSGGIRKEKRKEDLLFQCRKNEGKIKIFKS